MKRHRYLWILVGLLVFASLACNAFAGEPLEPTLPRPDLPGSGDGDDLAELPTAVIQNIAPTATLAGEFPATATPIVAEPVDGEPLLRALVDVNIRMGPGVAYGRDSFVLKGETAVVLGRHAESGWWKIVCPERADGNVCWVSGGSQYTSVNNAGAAQSVAAPPTAIPEPTAMATIAPTAVSDSSASSTLVDSTEAESVAGAGTNRVAQVVPPSTRMVYLDDNAVWVVTFDKNSMSDPVQLAEIEGEFYISEQNLLISPNGRYVAYFVEELTIESMIEPALYLIDLDTGEQRTWVDSAEFLQMVPDDELTAGIPQMQWLADSQSLAFNTTRIHIEGDPYYHYQQDLWTVDITGELRERFPAGEGGGAFAISPDNVVLFGRETAVVRANLDGTNKETIIEFPLVITYSESMFFPQIQWQTNGQDAHVAIAGLDPAIEIFASLWLVPQRGAAKSLTQIESVIKNDPVLWSPDGSQLGYARNIHTGPKSIFIAQGNGEESVEYATEGVDAFLSWNPAGSHFVYAGENYYAIGQRGEAPLIIDVAEGKTAVSAKWINNNSFVVAIGKQHGLDFYDWEFRLQTVDGPATRLISGNTTSLFDIWSP